MSQPETIGQILESTFPKSVQLSTTIKAGKEQITATVTDETAEGAKALLDQVKNLIGGEPVKATEPKAPGKRETKKNAELQARQMNELALLWMGRVKVIHPDFREMPEQKIAETLKFRSPMANMTAEESASLVEMLQQIATASAVNNADVAAYLRIVQVIEGLATAEEWETKKVSDIDGNDWKLIQVNGSHLLDAAKKELEARQALLSAAAMASAPAA